MKLSLRTVTIVSALVAPALGAIAMAGLWHPNAPEAAMTMYLPQITLATVVVAGVIDGINPCAFSVLLLFITALTSTLRLTALLGHSYLPLSNVGFLSCRWW